MRRIKKSFVFITNLLLISFLILLSGISCYLINIYTKTKVLAFEKQENIEKTSYILNADDQIVKTINNSIDYYVTYEDLSDDFINALISIEDASFFIHDGFDTKRILISLFNNIKEGKITQGASTITQQLAKNLALNNEKSYNRKIKEVMLAYKIEQKYSKKEILTYYANNISFEGTKYGINYASYRFFNKPINEVTLPEAAMLAAMAKSPTLYNPYNYPERCNDRKNLVLQAMYSNKYINKAELDIARKISVQDLLKKIPPSTIAYDNQAYFDVVYKEVFELTGLDPFTTPMKVHTYLNEELQAMLDKIQKNQNTLIPFTDEQQNIGGAVIDNQSGGIVGVLGGRNYNGEKLYNHAIDMHQQPASSIKPILSYALAYQHLNWSSAHVLKDVPTKYKGTDINVNNVDNTYLGELLIDDAIGYSRNTVAVQTLEDVIDVIGTKGVTDYLSAINLLDVSPDLFNYSYALGGMYNGVTPIQLAGAYSMLANYGVYKKPSAVKSIELLNEVETIDNTLQETRILDEDSAFLICNTLVNVVNKNYWGIGSVKMDGIDIGAKTGTSSFDQKAASKYGYPSNANKDIWFAGFSKDYSIAIWTGFDELSHTTDNYFRPSGDARVRTPRLIFKQIMELIADDNTSFEPTKNIVSRTIIKGTYPYLYPTSYIDNKFLINAYFKKDYLPKDTFAAPPLPVLNHLDIYHYANEIEIHFPLISDTLYADYKYGRSIYSLEEILGLPIYCLDVTLNGVTTTYKSETNIIAIPYELFSNYHISAYYMYENISSLKSNYYQTEISLW